MTEISLLPRRCRREASAPPFRNETKETLPLRANNLYTGGSPPPPPISVGLPRGIRRALFSFASLVVSPPPLGISSPCLFRRDWRKPVEPSKTNDFFFPPALLLRRHRDGFPFQTFRELVMELGVAPLVPLPFVRRCRSDEFFYQQHFPLPSAVDRSRH